MCLPDFFIIGAPKCGTTSLAHWLQQHPGVFLSTPKEPHFFNADMTNRRYTNEHAYRRLFAKAPADVEAVGEASTWYLASEAAVPAILRRQPDARLIILARDPVEMAVSLFIHNRRHGHEDQPTFEAAWRMQQRRGEGGGVPGMCLDRRYLLYAQACALGSQIERVLQHAVRSQVHLIWLDELSSDPEGTFRATERFLGLTRCEHIDFARHNEASEFRSGALLRLIRRLASVKRWLGIRRNFGLARLNERPAVRPELSEALVYEMNEVFERERVKLKHFFETM